MESRPPRATDDPDLCSVLAALTDDDCRDILEALVEPLSAQEISDICEIPLSTTYRKVNMLAEADLVDEEIDIRRGSKHTKRYVPDFDTVSITRNDEGPLTIDIHRVDEADRQLDSAWGEIRQEI